jgi:hypothetical protein
MVRKSKQRKSSPVMDNATTKISESDQLDEELQTVNDDDVEEHEEDVLAMAMAEKASALLRGKSAEFDRTFVPRISNQMAPSPEVIPEADTEHPDGEERSPPAATVIPSRPGAFSMVQHNASHDDDASQETASIEGELIIEHDGNKVIHIPRASLVSSGADVTELDLEDPMHQQKFPPIAEVVEMPPSEMVEKDDPAVPRRDSRRKLFRWLILLALLTIAAALIALLVEVNNSKKPEDKPEDKHDDNWPPRGPPRDKYPSINGGNFTEYDGDFSPIAFGGNNSQVDRNNTR